MTDERLIDSKTIQRPHKKDWRCVEEKHGLETHDTSTRRGLKHTVQHGLSDMPQHAQGEYSTPGEQSIRRR